jgi:hypothetical protein
MVRQEQVRQEAAKLVTGAGPRGWREETTGRLAAAIRSYKDGAELSEREVSWIRVYLRQWIEAPIWDCEPGFRSGSTRLAELRKGIGRLKSAVEIRVWLNLAQENGMNPF